jgi:two-component system, cell cycle sensor histidine kinase and response regulator CckA
MRLNLGYKLNGAIFLTFFVIVIIFTAIYVPYQNRRVKDITHNIEGVISILIDRDKDPLSNEIYQNLVEALNTRIEGMLKLKDMLLINVYNKDGKLLASRGEYPPDRQELSGVEINSLKNDTEIHYNNWHGQYTIIYTRELQIIGERIGFIRIYISMEGVKKELRVSYLILGCMLASILITMLGLLNFFLFRVIIKPIVNLSEAMDQMQTGKIEQHYNVISNDEIGDLSRAFNRMSWALAISYQELESQRKELQETKNYLSNIINSMPSMLLGVDIDMNVTQWNTQVEKITGLPAAAASGKKLADIFPQLAGEIDNVRQAMSDRVAKKNEDVTLEIHGGKIFMDVTVYPLTENGVGGAVIRIDDVTARKNTEDALLESEEKYRLVVDNANDGIVVIQDGKIKFANPRVVEVCGYTMDELIGMNFIDLVAGEDKDLTLRNYMSRVEGKGASKAYIFRIINRAGEKLWVDINIIMITWNGRPASLNFMRDITRQKKTEEQLQQAQKMEAVGTLAGGIAHDFNNLLQAIQGYAQLLLLNKEKSRLAQRELEEILGAAKRGGELTRQMLMFSRKVESNMQPTDLNIEVKKVEKILSRTIPKMIVIQVKVADDLNTVNADAGQIEQVLINLALNARDAMKDGGKILIETKNVMLDRDYCETHLLEKPGKYVLLSFSDTGHGISKDALGHIFEPFFTTKRVGEGTGLGLAMVYGIIMNHRGAIQCNSIPGKGTTFEIYLPAIESFKTPSVSDSIEMPKGGSETILLVDDEAVLRDIGKQILEKFGYTVLTAVDGEKALDIYRSKLAVIDLVILDLIMPGMGGIKCLAELLKINPEIKVIISSGYSIDGGEDSPSKGAKGFIKKPYILEGMLKEVRRVLDKSQVPF